MKEFLPIFLSKNTSKCLFLSAFLSVFLCSFVFLYQNEIYQTNHGKVELFFDIKPQATTAKLKNANSTIHLKDAVKSDSVFFNFFTENLHFDNGLAEIHIKDKYLETNKYPKISFKGKFSTPVDYNNPNPQVIKVKGILQMKKIKKEEEIPVTITIKNNNLKMHTDFVVEASNYGILDQEKRFKDGKDNIKVKLDATYKLAQ